MRIMRIYNEWWQALPTFNLFLISLLRHFSFVIIIVCKLLFETATISKTLFGKHNGMLT